MQSYRLNNMAITIEKEAVVSFSKATFPIKFGKYTEIRTPEYEFQFNMKGGIKFIRGLHGRWPHPSELLKRTDGNDWVFYSVGSVNRFKGVKDWLGEYYLPCLPYVSNAIWEFNPFADMNVMTAFAAWSQLYANIRGAKLDGAPPKIKEFLQLIAENDESVLYKQAQKLHAIMGGRLSVLPPDTRHVDYEIIPLIIADGCLYHCDFCSVKSDQRFHPRSRGEIVEQIRLLKEFYGPALSSYNALFLGNHDALMAGGDLIDMAVSEAVKAFGFKNEQDKMPKLYLFGSVDSFLRADNDLLEMINSFPFHTYINIGFESVDPATLASINKPLEAFKVKDAFWKMLEINRDFSNVEVTGNFLLGEMLSPDHNQSMAELVASPPDQHYSKGAIYLSPLMESKNRQELLQSFFEIKKQSRLPAFIYLIQRL